MTLLKMTLLSATLALAYCPADAQDIVINIKGPGQNGKYIKEGDASQLPVTVMVGQTVRFNNLGTTTHNATSDKKDAAGAPLFKTGNLAVGAKADVVFDAALFAAAGGAAGGSVDLPYKCTIHPATMKSLIVLTDASVLPPASPLRVRKNVALLTPAEIVSLRKGVEVMRSRPENNRTSWKYWANIHGMLVAPPAPDPVLRQCKHGTIDFLVWHRAYLYYFGGSNANAAVLELDHTTSPAHDLPRPRRHRCEFVI